MNTVVRSTGRGTLTRPRPARLCSSGSSRTVAVIGALGVVAATKAVLLGDLPGDDDDHPGRVLHRPGRAVPRCRTDRGVYRRGDDAVPVRADAHRRRFLRIPGREPARSAGRRDRGGAGIRTPADRRHRQCVRLRLHRSHQANAGGNVEGAGRTRSSSATCGPSNSPARC